MTSAMQINKQICLALKTMHSNGQHKGIIAAEIWAGGLVSDLLIQMDVITCIQLH